LLDRPAVLGQIRRVTVGAPECASDIRVTRPLEPASPDEPGRRGKDRPRLDQLHRGTSALRSVVQYTRRERLYTKLEDGRPREGTRRRRGRFAEKWRFAAQFFGAMRVMPFFGSGGCVTKLGPKMELSWSFAAGVVVGPGVPAGGPGCCLASWAALSA